MKWTKLGHIFTPENNHPWMMTHASNPVAEHLTNDVFRIYFSCRDKRNVSSIGFVDVNINPPFNIIRISDKPVLSPGDIGTFDDSGVSLGSIVVVSGKKYLFYVGWNLSVTVPWRNSIGLAVSDEQTGNYKKISKAPIMDRSDADPFSLSYPFVQHNQGVFRMWYGTNLDWGKAECEMKHVIKYAESMDGMQWQRTGEIAVNFKNNGEYAISRPCVINEQGLYKMWYAYRGKSYRIGYAESEDGKNWTRKDEDAGIDISEAGWDSEMICYPYVFDYNDKKYMLYNGNGYGKTGFGIAVLAD